MIVVEECVAGAGVMKVLLHHGGCQSGVDL